MFRSLTLAFVVTGFLAACSGERGPQGNAGDPGATGAQGPAGPTALVRTSSEAAGTNCATGGIKVEVGTDANGNGVLDDAEVTASSTTWVCNGAAGTNGTNGSNGSNGSNGTSGHDALVHTSPELPGIHCPAGGTRIDSGVDSDGDGTLSNTEVTATTYVCTPAAPGQQPSTGVNVLVQDGGITTSTSGAITVRFTLRDDQGYPLDLNGRYSANQAMQPRFALAWFARDSMTNLVSPYTTYTRLATMAVPAGEPTTYDPIGSGATQGVIVENGLGAGDYSYTFPETSTSTGPMAVKFDATKLDRSHVLWIQVTRQTDRTFPQNPNTFFAANAPTYFVPSGMGTPLVRELVSQAACDGCHARFKAETPTSAARHGGGRVAVGSCNLCHNPERVSNPAADSAVFVHRIHASARVATSNLFRNISGPYPRDLNDCSVCHSGAAQGGQALTNPSSAACNGCHDYVSYTGAFAGFCRIAGQLQLDSFGKPLPCNHVGGIVSDATCATCHGPSGGFPSASFHRPVVAPDPTNSWLPGGTNANTNAAWVAAGGFVPAGADVITWDVRSVSTELDTSVTPNVLRPVVFFKFKRNGADVVFPAWSPTVTELMPNFVGSPSVYFAFAVPQDGVTAPADFNASASGYLKRIWDGTATGSGAGVLTGPDMTGFYKVRLTGVRIPASAVMLTGGIGYTLSLSASPPLVQTNVPGFGWVPNMPADGKAQGGLSVPAPNVWKTATGYAPRRSIVDSAKCNSCHGALGVSPKFHAGQRNDAATCSFCHNANRSVAGWANTTSFAIHGLHSARQRSVALTTNVASRSRPYDEVAFPGTLVTCTSCHVAGSYDYSSAESQAALPNLPLVTAATGIFNSDPQVNSTYFTGSPMVVADGMTNYGAGFSYNPSTDTTAQASSVNLVLSPVTAACVSCHDSAAAVSHMKSNGGSYYVTRSTALLGAPEQCLVCHGPGRVAAIGVVHARP